MEFSLYFKNKTFSILHSYKHLFMEITHETFECLNKEGNYEISLTFVNNKQIQDINREYRNIDKVTDVISFAFNDVLDTIADNDEIPNDLGDIIISLPRARKQAKEYNHSLKREVCFLYLHGLLHLLGYDHMNEQDEKKMFDLQDQILSRLNILREE